MAHIDLEFTRQYDLPADRLWPVVADLDGYAGHVPGLAATEVLSGAELGAVRRCEDTRGNDWTEAVSEWRPGDRYSIDVDTSTYPTPLRQLFRAFRGTWIVEPSDRGATATIRFAADVRGGPLAAWFVRPLLQRAMRGSVESTLVSYGEAAAG